MLRSYPSEYIFEPWTAPRHVQEMLKCVIGRDYPKPMIDHQKALRINMDKMRAVYQQVLSKSSMYQSLLPLTTVIVVKLLGYIGFYKLRLFHLR